MYHMQRLVDALVLIIFRIQGLPDKITCAKSNSVAHAKAY